MIIFYLYYYHNINMGDLKFMNIFILDSNMKKNARYHCNKHVNKMIIEQTQLLCSVYYYTNIIPDSIYKLIHNPDHKCAKWTRESLSNWIWLRDMTLALTNEYSFRYKREHKCQKVVEGLSLPHIKDIGLTSFALAMPEYCKVGNAVESYRYYYNNEKRHLFKWKNRPIPYWIEDSSIELKIKKK